MECRKYFTMAIQRKGSGSRGLTQPNYSPLAKHALLVLERILPGWMEKDEATNTYSLAHEDATLSSFRDELFAWAEARGLEVRPGGRAPPPPRDGLPPAASQVLKQESFRGPLKRQAKQFVEKLRERQALRELVESGEEFAVPYTRAGMPAQWWADEHDRDLLKGVFRHGCTPNSQQHQERQFKQIIEDETLCFSAMIAKEVGAPSEPAAPAPMDVDAADGEGSADAGEAGAAPAAPGVPTWASLAVMRKRYNLLMAAMKKGPPKRMRKEDKAAKTAAGESKAAAKAGAKAKAKDKEAKAKAVKAAKRGQPIKRKANKENALPVRPAKAAKQEPAAEEVDAASSDDDDADAFQMIEEKPRPPAGSRGPLPTSPTAGSRLKGAPAPKGKYKQLTLNFGAPKTTQPDGPPAAAAAAPVEPTPASA